MAFLKPEILLGSGGRRVLSLYHLYVGGGEPSVSWQDSWTVVPVVTEVGTLHNGGDGGTVGCNISFQQVSTCTVIHNLITVHKLKIKKFISEY